MSEPQRLSERIIRFFDKCCLGNYNSNDASSILADVKALESQRDQLTDEVETWKKSQGDTYRYADELRTKLESAESQVKALREDYDHACEVSVGFQRRLKETKARLEAERDQLKASLESEQSPLESMNYYVQISDVADAGIVTWWIWKEKNYFFHEFYGKNYVELARIVTYGKSLTKIRHGLSVHKLTKDEFNILNEACNRSLSSYIEKENPIDYLDRMGYGKNILLLAFSLEYEIS